MLRRLIRLEHHKNKLMIVRLAKEDNVNEPCFALMIPWPHCDAPLRLQRNICHVYYIRQSTKWSEIDYLSGSGTSEVSPPPIPSFNV